MHVYQIIRAQGSPDGEPGFPSGPSLANLGLHEFGHSFVNPALEKANADGKFTRGMDAIFAPVAGIMEKQAYGHAPVFLNELVLRAACIMAGRDLGIMTRVEAEMAVKSERWKGFYPIQRVVEILEEYRASRARYPDFESFAPELLERLSSESDDIVADGARDGYSGKSAAKPSGIEGFMEDFETTWDTLFMPSSFTMELGATSKGGKGSGTLVRLDGTAAASGGSSFTLEADAGTSAWYYLCRTIRVKGGTLALRYMARGDGIRTERGQFGGSYVGFIITDTSGKKKFSVREHEGSFPWSEFSVEATIDPTTTKSIEFAVFLNETGTLGVDDISVAYR